MTMLTRTARALIPALSLVLAVATGCAVAGNPLPQYIDPATLDSGAYGIEPLDEPAGNETYGRIVESARMAEALISPSDADPGMRFGANTYGVQLVPTPAKARMFLAEPVRAVVEREAMVAGCATSGADRELKAKQSRVGEARVLTVIVLRFPDADAATRAARDIDAVDAAVSTENVTLGIPEYPQAHAHWRPGVPSMAASLASGSYVVTLLIGHTAPDAEAMTALARSAFSAQVPLLHEFAPTPPAEIAALPVDREGMIRRMVPPTPRRWLYPAVVSATSGQTARWDARIIAVGVVYGPRAARLWGYGGAAVQSVEMIAINSMNTLYRYPTATVARTVFTARLARDATEDGQRVIDGPGGVPDISCFEYTEAGVRELVRYGCRVLHGRYYAIVMSRDRATVLEKAAAQYGLLVAG